MNIAVVSYSFTNNNERFAASIAAGLSAKHIRIQPTRPVTYGTLTLDLLLNRKPDASPNPESLAHYDLLLFVSPIWMGQVAFPLRAYLAALKRRTQPYCFLSISGGADGVNPKIPDELKNRAGQAPVFVLDQHIRDQLPAEPAPTRDDTSKYQLTDEDLAQITRKALEQLKLNVPSACSVRVT